MVKNENITRAGLNVQNVKKSILSGDDRIGISLQRASS